MTSNTKIVTDVKTKALLICGTLACPLFIALVLIQGAKRPDYNSFLYPLSSLSIGKSGWIQVSNFIATGTLLILFSIGLNKVFRSSGVKSHAQLLIGLVGIGLIGAGIFVTDPIFGYPADKPLILKQFTIHGHLHDAFSTLVFICLPWTCFVFRKCFRVKGEPGWATYSVLTGFGIIIMFIITSAGFQQLPGFVNFAGLFQRLCVFTGLMWIALTSLHLLRRQSATDNKNTKTTNR
jgi:hypothetical protein